MTLTRRAFVKTLTGGSLIAGFSSLTRSWVASAAPSTPAPFERLPPLHGTLSLDDATRQAYAQDYGQIVHEQPSAVLRPGSVDDVVTMVRFARRRGLRIVARGQGHQPFGQAQIDAGVVIDMRSLRAVHSIAPGRVDVDAGADWRAVVQAALSRGQMPPVLTAYLGLTVAGTLSIGGVGMTTHRHGAQVDHVLQLQVVTGEGKVVTCSNEKHRDLFEAALAGQGQCGIITRAALRLVGARTMVREHVLPYDDVTTLMQDGASLTADGHLAGAVAVIAPGDGRWTYSLVATRQFSPPEDPDDAALRARLRYARGSERARTVGQLQHADAIPHVAFGPSRPDLGLCVPGSAAASFIGAMLPRLTDEDLGPASGLRLFFWKREPFARPLFRIPREETFVYVAILRAPTTDPSLVARMLAGNRTLFEGNRDLGGALYPFSALELSPVEWQQHYGTTWTGLARAKHRYDPDHVLASGPDLFRARRR